MIETLDRSNQPEIVEVFGGAFHDHPLMPPDPSGRRARRLVKSLLAAFAAAPNAQVFGIRREGRVVSAAFVFDAAYEPRGLTLVLLLMRMLRMLGWRLCRTFARIMASKPEASDRGLELMILGTRVDFQGQGLGRELLQHVLEFAHDEGYQSVVLEVAKETPAFGFYLREGFRLQKEIDLPTMPLCFLRRPLND